MKANRSDFLELSQEILEQGALLRFRAPGNSMHPFIENGDILVVEPSNGAQAHIGDVIFYHRPDGRLIAHRLIRIQNQGDSVALITQGDSLRCPDPPLRPEQVLGRVIAVERDGRFLGLDSGLNKAMSSSWARLSPSSRWLRPILKPGWKLYRMVSPAGLRDLFELCLRLVQGIPVYRRVAASLRKGIEIKEAGEEDKRHVYNWLNPEQTKSTVLGRLNVTCFVAKKGDRIIGSVELVRRPEQSYPHDGYWLISLTVRTLNRGMGIGEKLCQTVMDKSRKEEAKGLSLLVNEYNHRAIRLYRKLGFEMRVIPALEKQLDDERGTLGYRRVLMFARLDGKDDRQAASLALPQSQSNSDKADTQSEPSLLVHGREADE